MNKQTFASYREQHMARRSGAHRVKTLDKVILAMTTVLFFLAAVQAAENELTPGQYYFLKRNLEAEYSAARAICTVKIGAAREKCIAEAIVHRKRALSELNLAGSSATVPE